MNSQIRRSRTSFLALLGGMLIAGYSVADSWQPSHSCYEPTKPSRPYSLDNEWEINRYNSALRSYNYDVEEFRTCIENFVSEQESAIRNHKYAAESAINDWNNFVNWN